MNLKDFSKKTGINQSTISIALNNYPDISQKTKDTILQLAKKYKYNPNKSAQFIGSIKTSSNFKVLIADKISETSYRVFKNNNISVDKKFNLSENEIISIISNYDGVIVRSSTKITKKIIEKSKRLKVIARAGVGVDNVDVKSATSKGVIVMNSPQSTSRTTAEHAISLIFSLARKIPFAHFSTISKKWEKELFKGIELKSKTVGLIGCGNIGSEVAKIARSLQMNVMVYDPYLSVDRIESVDAEKSSLEEVLKFSDFVSLHLPILKSTKNIIYSKKIKLLGPSGSGQLTKMVNQICIAGLVQGLSEAINFGINAGLDMDIVMETISKGAAQSWQMENRYRTMTDDVFDYGFAVDWMRKDLAIVIEEAKKNGSPVPITELIDGYYAKVQEMGGNRWDSSSLIALLKKKK